MTRVPKVKVGVVGEIYVKYSPLGNNDLQKFLESQDLSLIHIEMCIRDRSLDRVRAGSGFGGDEAAQNGQHSC